MSPSKFTFAPLVACAITIAGCRGPTGSKATAVLQMSSNPSTVNPVDCPPSHCGPLTGQREVTSTVTVRETAGVGGVVNRVSLTLRRQSDNASIAAGEIPAAQGTRFSANGTIALPMAMHYDATLGERNMKVVVALEARDDNGHALTITIEIEVISP